MRFYFKRLFTFVCCLFAYTFMFGGKSLANPGDYLIYYLGKNFKDESLECCMCNRSFLSLCKRYSGDLYFGLYGPFCYVKYNDEKVRDIETVFRKAKNFNDKGRPMDAKKYFFKYVGQATEFSVVDSLVKEYFRKLNGLFCADCMQFILLTLNTEEYCEFRNKSLMREFEKRSDVCVVCLNNFEEKINNFDLKMCPECINCFHDDCIRSWLSSNNYCPLCKTSYKTPGVQLIPACYGTKGIIVKYKNYLFDDSYNTHVSENSFTLKKMESDFFLSKFIKFSRDSEKKFGIVVKLDCNGKISFERYDNGTYLFIKGKMRNKRSRTGYERHIHDDIKSVYLLETL